jgi:hypothetical protein
MSQLAADRQQKNFGLIRGPGWPISNWDSMWNDPITSPFQTASQIGLHEKTWGPGSSYREPVSYLFGLKKIQTRNRVDDRLSLSKMISIGEKKPILCVHCGVLFLYLWRGWSCIPRGEGSLPSLRNILSFFGKLKRIAVGFFFSVSGRVNDLWL